MRVDRSLFIPLSVPESSSARDPKRLADGAGVIRASQELRLARRAVATLTQQGGSTI